MNYFKETKTNILENPKLRDPQIEAYVEVFNHFIMEDKTNTHAIVVLPTGVGKTGLMAILPFNIAVGRVLIIAPQLTILNTIESSLNPADTRNFWIDRGIIDNPYNLPVLVVYEGNDTRREHMDSANIVLANIQKMQSRNYSSLLNQYPEDYFDMIIIDEAHHAEARTWIETLSHFSNAKVVKITATPYRTDKKELVGTLVYKYKLSQAMSNMYVKSLEKFNYIPDQLYLEIEDDENLYTVDEILSNEKYDEDWIARSVAYSEECKISVVKKSAEILEQKRKGTTVPHKIIAAAPNVKEARAIAELYNVHTDYKAIAVHNELSKSDRESIFTDIENHRYDVVVNVSMMGEGYDHKYLSVAAIFRVFKNILPYEQFIGRILRAIPQDEMNKPEDNIGSVVVHEHLNLDGLWNYYKEQLQESEFIDQLRELDTITEFSGEENSDNQEVDKIPLAVANEVGEGSLSRSVYMETEYIKKREQEAKDRKDKIDKLIEILGVTEKQASDIIDSQDGESSSLKRPDLILKQRQKTTDKTIREQIVPELLIKYDLDLKGAELRILPLFSGRYAWISNTGRDNGAMLAIYFNTYLKNQIGRKREEWSNEDFERAAYLLEQQANYVDNYLRGGNYENNS